MGEEPPSSSGRGPGELGFGCGREGLIGGVRVSPTRWGDPHPAAGRGRAGKDFGWCRILPDKQPCGAPWLPLPGLPVREGVTRPGRWASRPRTSSLPSAIPSRSSSAGHSRRRRAFQARCAGVSVQPSACRRPCLGAAPPAPARRREHRAQPICRGPACGEDRKTQGGIMRSSRVPAGDDIARYSGFS